MPLEPGVMFWPWVPNDPRGTLRLIEPLNVRHGQLGMPGDADISNRAASAWRAACEATDFIIATVFAAYDGESYADIATVDATVGLVPETTRAKRLERTFQLSDFAHALDVPGIACHIGFVPEDSSNPAYAQMVDLVGKICDRAATNGQTFALETGQEPAAALAAFIQAVGRPNLKINFDPANMLLYGTGDPMEALRILSPWITTVHAKDGNRPAAAGQLGIERRLGEGSVYMERFVEKLKQVGYRGGLFVEREVENLSERLADMNHGITLLRRLAHAEQQWTEAVR